MNPRDRLRSVGSRVTEPAESLARQVTARVVELLIDTLDPNKLLANVDLDALLSRVDPDAFIARVDIDALLDRVDVNALLARVDVNALLDRVDVNALMARVDMDAMVQNTDLGALIAGSTGGVASDFLDAARSQAVGLDLFIDRWVRRLLRRGEPGPAVPPGLLAPSTVTCALTSARAAP